MSSTPLPKTNIVHRVDEIITRAVNARTGGSKSFKSIDTAKLAENIPADEWRFAPVLEELWQQIVQNWTQGGCQAGGKENWRWKLQLKMNSENPSEETKLEKRLANVLPAESWANQIPAASGLVGSGDRKRNIDLAHWDAGNRVLTLIELKVHLEGTDQRETPLGAAFQLIQYALLLCLARAHQSSDAPRINVIHPKIWTEALGSHLRVVAPRSFFQGLERSSISIERALDEAVASFGKSHGLEMTFGFRAFDWFSRPRNEEEFLQCLNQRISLAEG